MAGIIAGRDAGAQPRTKKDDATPYLGVAPDARIVSVKVGDSRGAVDVSQVIAGIDWVVQNAQTNGMNIRVLNLSLGYPATQDYRLDPLSYAAEQAWKRGIVVVASAGNDGTGTGRLMMPAANPFLRRRRRESTPTARATPDDDTIPDFSTRGDNTRRPDVVAPGQQRADASCRPTAPPPRATRRSLLDGRFLKGSGTSEAAAQVSGAVALMLEAHPALTPDQVKANLREHRDVPQVRGRRRAGPRPRQRRQGGRGQRPDGAQGGAELRRRHRHRLARRRPRRPATGRRRHRQGPRRRARHHGPDVRQPPSRPSLQVARARAGPAAAGTARAGAARSWSGASWSGASWSGATWSGASWSGASWSGPSWSGASWSGARWSGASWTRRELEQRRLAGLQLEVARDGTTNGTTTTAGPSGGPPSRRSGTGRSATRPGDRCPSRWALVLPMGSVPPPHGDAARPGGTEGTMSAQGSRSAPRVLAVGAAALLGTLLARRPVAGRLVRPRGPVRAAAADGRLRLHRAARPARAAGRPAHAQHLASARCRCCSAWSSWGRSGSCSPSPSARWPSSSCTAARRSRSRSTCSGRSRSRSSRSPPSRRWRRPPDRPRGPALWLAGYAGDDRRLRRLAPGRLLRDRRVEGRRPSPCGCSGAARPRSSPATVVTTLALVAVHALHDDPRSVVLLSAVAADRAGRLPRLRRARRAAPRPRAAARLQPRRQRHPPPRRGAALGAGAGARAAAGRLRRRPPARHRRRRRPPRRARAATACCARRHVAPEEDPGGPARGRRCSAAGRSWSRATPATSACARCCAASAAATSVLAPLPGDAGVVGVAASPADRRGDLRTFGTRATSACSRPSPTTPAPPCRAAACSSGCSTTPPTTP